MSEQVQIPPPPPEDTAPPVETCEDGYATPETAAPSSQSDGQVIAGMFAGGVLVADTVQRMIRGQADACQASRELQTWDTNIWRPGYLRSMTRLRNLADRLVLHIDNVYRTRGGAGGTGTPLEVFLAQEFGGIEAGTRALMPWSDQPGRDPWRNCAATLAFTPACRLAWIRNHLPPAPQIRDTSTISRDTSNGFHPGVGYDGPPVGNSRFGTLCGPAVIDAIEQWKLLVRRDSSPPGFPRIRQRMTFLAGTWEGTGPYGTFSPPTNPESIFLRSAKDTGGTFETAASMPGSVIALPDLDGVCSGVSSRSWRYLPTAANGDPFLEGSRLYEVVRFRLYQADLKDCMIALCQARGGPDGQTPLGPSALDTLPPVSTDEGMLAGLESVPDWALYAAAGLAALVILR